MHFEVLDEFVSFDESAEVILFNEEVVNAMLFFGAGFASGV